MGIIMIKENTSNTSKQFFSWKKLGVDTHP